MVRAGKVGSTQASLRTHARTIAIALVAIAAAGCTDGRIAFLPGDGPPASVRAAAGSEPVAGHTNPTQTWPGGYTVSTSTGTIASRPVGVTPSGFRVYSSVQGALLSEDIQ
jgi:hypothetical protein